MEAAGLNIAQYFPAQLGFAGLLLLCMKCLQQWTYENNFLYVLVIITTFLGWSGHKESSGFMKVIFCIF